jgi:hypothetical protein
VELRRTGAGGGRPGGRLRQHGAARLASEVGQRVNQQHAWNHACMIHARSSSNPGMLHQLSISAACMMHDESRMSAIGQSPIHAACSNQTFNHQHHHAVDL